MLCLFFYHRKLGLDPDKEAFDKHIADLSGKLDVYDKILSKQKYLLGDVKTVSTDWYVKFLLTRFPL